MKQIVFSRAKQQEGPNTIHIADITNNHYVLGINALYVVGIRKLHFESGLYGMYQLNNGGWLTASGFDEDFRRASVFSVIKAVRDQMPDGERFVWYATREAYLFFDRVADLVTMTPELLAMVAKNPELAAFNR
jgi:hypothetical protein